VPALDTIRELRSHLSVRPARRLVRDLLLRTSDSQDLTTYREDLARSYLKGSGIEIGALHRPVRLPADARARYVDIMSREDLLAAHSPAVYGNPKWVVETDVIDDGERLSRFADESVDFVIANHMLEHAEDPIAAIEQLVRVLTPGGVLFLTLPDPRRTFDALRTRTTVEHVLRDHEVGPECSRQMHYEEWARVECVPDEQIAERVAEFAREGTRHHFHVWELEDFLELVHALRLPVRLALAQTHLDEFAVVLRRETKSGGGS
jgi:predicted SAM-dependent methyltransferase